MKRGFSYGLAGFAAITALVAAAPFLLPAGLYKARIEQSVTHATGRAFIISGPLHFALFPSLGFRADNVTLANLPGGRLPSLATADEVRFGVQLLPLFSGRLEITRITLDRPTLNLEVDAQGQANWILLRKRKAATQISPSYTTVVEQFSGIEIARGHVTYSNVRSGSSYALDDIDAVIDFTKLDKPAQLAGGFTFANRRVTFKAIATTPELLLHEQVSGIDLSLTSELTNAGFKGTIDPDGVLSGNARVDTSSVRAAATWLGARLPESGGFGALSLQSRIDGDDRHLRLSEMTLALDGMKAIGAIALDTSRTIPHASGALTLDHLDLNPYIERPHRPGVARAYPDKERWSDMPITLDLLKKANVDMTLDVGTLTLRKLRLGKSRIVVALNDAQLNARLDPVMLYGGSGKAVLHVDAHNTPVFRNVMEFHNVALQPFLSSTIGVKQIEGLGTISLDVTSKGASADAIMHNLTGRGSIDFHDGQLRGIDLGAVARTVQALLGGAIHPDAFTAYGTMKGNFTMANGVLTNTDFQLTGPVLHMTGSGAVDAGNRTIDFRLIPQATAIIAKQKLSVGLPFHIRGPWKHVHYTPDVAGVVGGVMDNLKNGRAPFKNLFGGNKAPKDPNAPKKKHKNIGDALKNMFGIH